MVGERWGNVSKECEEVLGESFPIIPVSLRLGDALIKVRAFSVASVLLELPFSLSQWRRNFLPLSHPLHSFRAFDPSKIMVSPKCIA